MMPHADQSFGQISDHLGNIMSGTGQIPSPEISSGALSLDDEAVKIIEEATAVVEENTRNKFPDLHLRVQNQGLKAQSTQPDSLLRNVTNRPLFFLVSLNPSKCMKNIFD